MLRYSVRRSRSASSFFQKMAHVWVLWPRVSAVSGIRMNVAFGIFATVRNYQRNRQ